MLGLLVLPVAVLYWIRVTSQIANLRASGSASAERRVLIARVQQRRFALLAVLLGFGYGLADVTAGDVWIQRGLLVLIGVALAGVAVNARAAGMASLR